MSTIPPNVPPGGPYDPKTQWRIHREQQKTAWRAQREAWKAQRQAWKNGMMGPYVPRVPSLVGPVLLIGVGVVALLLMTGHLACDQFWGWYSRWWPLILIGAGLALLAEWAIDMRRELPVRRSGGFIWILVLLAFIGFGSSGWNHGQPWFHHFGDDNDFNLNSDFFNSFGQPEHDLDVQAQFTQIPANAVIEIDNPRGDVSVTAANASTIEVLSHEVAYASSDGEAKNIFDAETAHVTVSGTAVRVNSEGNQRGRINLTITVPKNAQIHINSGKGDVNAAELGAGLSLNAHGDVRLSSIKGPVGVHYSNGKHDLSANQIEGDLTLDGDCNDLTVSEIKGKLTQSGEILGDVHLENVAGAVHLHTTVTDLQLTALPGDLTLNAEDLHVTDARGPVHVITHSKDIDLSEIAGDTYVEDRDGRISVEPSGNYGVVAKNSKGDVEVTLLPNASATVVGNAHNGDIVTEFALPVSGEESKTVSGRIGAGAAKIVLSAENGDVRIKKGSGNAAPPSANPAAPHLKPSKALTAQPVTQ